MPQSHEKEDQSWIKYLKRLINMFYCSSAVKNVSLNEKEWRIELFMGNNPAWLRPHLNDLLEEITVKRNQIDLKSPNKIIVV